ncbi:MAG: 2-C-methyl-D-erythritol 4-phosphate cytidylyltransferase [Lysobacteraceae bacterium]
MSWVVVPAAGVGTRMQSEVPKQYLMLFGKTILEHTLRRLLSHPHIEGVMLALAENDVQAAKIDGMFQGKPVLRCIGGQHRAASVEAGLRALPVEVGMSDWVLVHDAARPCVRHADLDRLFAALESPDIAGALLAAPVRDTLKGAGAGSPPTVQTTIDRSRYWRAFTPQVFRRGELIDALQQAARAGLSVTDEASAMEQRTLPIRLVEGSEDNIKLTTPSDLALIEFILGRQGMAT